MRKKLAGIGLLISLVVALYSASMVVGEQARLVDVLTLFFSGMAVGASLTSYLICARTKGRDSALPTPERQA